MNLFYVLVRNLRGYMLLLGEELRIFVHELYEVAPSGTWIVIACRGAGGSAVNGGVWISEAIVEG